MARRERLERVVDRLAVSGTGRPVVHVIRESRPRRLRELGHVWHTDGVKVRTESSDQPLEEDL